MQWTPDQILSVLDRCCDTFSFPMLDNGYVYLAATRMSLFRSSVDWAIVFEIFGFSPREGEPSTTVQTFASHLHHRDSPEQYVTRQAYDAYLANHPNNEFRSVYAIDSGPWQDVERGEYVASDARSLLLRGKAAAIPAASEFASHGIELEQAPRIRVFELCRYLAAVRRNDVLATTPERRVSVLPTMGQIRRLEEWKHPDVARGERPSGSKTFQQLAEVLVSGNVTHYHPTAEPNTHWRHWPEGGRL